MAIARLLTKLRPSGSCFRGACPCCSPGLAKDNFLVDPAWGNRPPHFHCFQCGVDGDVVTLAYFHQTGKTQIPDDQFPAIIRSVAAAYGIAIPEPTGQSAWSSVATRRTAIRELWEAAHAWCVSQFEQRRALVTAAADSSRPGSAAQLRRFPMGYFTADLRDHLGALGIEDETRLTAGLSDQDLARLDDGPVVLRSVAGAPAGFSQQQCKGGTAGWVHLSQPNARFDPALAGSPPRGRDTDRLLIFVPDIVRALRVSGAIRQLQQGDSEASRRATAFGLVIAPPNDPLDPRSVRALTRRAVILLHGPGTNCATTAQHGAALLDAGLAVRVADGPPFSVDGLMRRTDVLAAMADWDAAPDFFGWQWTARQAELPAGRDLVAVARHWFDEEVSPLLRRCADPAMVRLLAHRAARVCGLAMAPENPSTVIPATVGVSAQAGSV